MSWLKKPSNNSERENQDVQFRGADFKPLEHIIEYNQKISLIENNFDWVL